MKTPINFTGFTSVKPTEEETAPEKNNASETISSAGGDLRKRKAEKILEKIEPGEKATEEQQKELLKLKKGSMRYEDRNEKRKERYAAYKDRVDAKRERYAEKMLDKLSSLKLTSSDLFPTSNSCFQTNKFTSPKSERTTVALGPK